MQFLQIKFRFTKFLSPHVSQHVELVPSGWFPTTCVALCGSWPVRLYRCWLRVPLFTWQPANDCLIDVELEWGVCAPFVSRSMGVHLEEQSPLLTWSLCYSISPCCDPTFSANRPLLAALRSAQRNRSSATPVSRSVQRSTCDRSHRHHHVDARFSP